MEFLIVHGLIEFCPMNVAKDRVRINENFWKEKFRVNYSVSYVEIPCR